MAVLIRKQERTNHEWGKSPDERSVEELIVNGVVNLDKPSGPTSFQVVDWVKKIFHLKKAGHGGTLDPAVTGILPITLDNATKVMKVFLFAKKEYVALMHLHGDVDEEAVKEAMAKFIGKITQLPPKRSRVKRVEREREIYYLEFLEKNGRDVLFKVGTQHGTYIRRLAEQIGKELGIGAHLIELRRTKAGGFSEEDHLVNLQDLEDALVFWKEGNEKYIRHCIWPVERAVEHIPKVWVFDATVEALCQGAKLHVPGLSKLDDTIEKEQVIAVMSLKNELIGLGTSKMTSKEMMEEKNGLAVKMDRIVMKSGVYPKMWKKEKTI